MRLRPDASGESSGEVGQVNISAATYALVKDVVDGSLLPVVSSPSSGLATDSAALITRKAFAFEPRPAMRRS